LWPFETRRGEARLVVASNRGPISVTAVDDGEDQVDRGGGGLVSGMLAALKDRDDVVWVCAALNDAERALAREADHGHVSAPGFGQVARAWDSARGRSRRVRQSGDTRMSTTPRAAPTTTKFAQTQQLVWPWSGRRRRAEILGRWTDLFCGQSRSYQGTPAACPTSWAEIGSRGAVDGRGVLARWRRSVSSADIARDRSRSAREVS